MAKNLGNIQLVGRISYPWDEWCNGDVWEVQYKKDFNTEVKHFRAQLHMRAIATNQKCITERVGEDRLRFQFVERD